MKKRISGGLLRAYLFTLILECASLSLLALAFALFLSLLSDPIAYVEICSLASLIIGAAVCGSLSRKIAGSSGRLVTYFSTLTLALILILASVIYTSAESLPLALMNAGIYIAVFAVTGSITPRKARRRKFARR